MSRIVVVSNRVPRPDAGMQAGGLAVVLGGLMERRGGLWFGWDGRVRDDAATAAVESVVRGDIEYATIPLNQTQHDGYYNGFSNSVLWPLLHTLPELIKFDRRDAACYRAVNLRFASALAPLLRPSDQIWVHDYHLLPLAAALRGHGVRNAIGFFLHIPFPATDVLSCVPGAADLVRDMLAADLIGFQTENDLAQFAVAAEMFGGAARTHGTVLVVDGRRVRLGVFPVEIEPREVAAMAACPTHHAATASLRRSLDGQALIIGAERLDPTKGLLQRVAGYRRLLDSQPAWRGRVTMLQIAATSRKEVGAYRDLRAALDRETGALNTDLGAPDWLPLRLLSRGVERPLLAAYMREARIGLVTPLRDGMNLVAKEFVASQDPADPGVLVLSRFAGAANQLRSALLVDPRDPESIAEAIGTALAMPLGERQGRWQALWGAIEHRTPLAWGRSFLETLSRDRAFAEAERVLSVRPAAARLRRLQAAAAPAADRVPLAGATRPLTAGPDRPPAGQPLH